MSVERRESALQRRYTPASSSNEPVAPGVTEPGVAEFAAFRSSTAA